jgi:DNA-directed RNA polymerase specialized sigma24 family protein
MIELYNAALTQEPAAVRRFVVRITPLVQARVARTLLKYRGASSMDTAQEVKDMLQEVLLVLFAHDARVLKAWDEERGLSLENFIGLVSERETISMLRSGKRSAWRETSTDETTLFEAASVHNHTEASLLSADMLKVLLQQMHLHTSPLGFAVFRMMFVEERSVEDICTQLSMSDDAVYAWKSRLVKQAKKLAQTLLEPSKGRVA